MLSVMKKFPREWQKDGSDSSLPLFPSQVPTLPKRPGNLTQLEVSVQDTPLVQILEARKDLAQVVANLWFQKGVPGLPDVGQGLQKATVSVPACLPRPALHLCLLRTTGTQFWILRTSFLPFPPL